MAPHHLQCEVKVLDVAPGSLAIFHASLSHLLGQGRNLTEIHLQAQQLYS